MNSQIRLSITGMACAGCVSSVEKSLLAVDGVNEAIVNLDEHTAIVSGEVTTDVLIDAIKKAGYDASELKSLADDT